MRPFVSLAALMVCMSTTPAAAQLQVLGQSPAAACYRHAMAERHDVRAMQDCDIALRDGRVSRRDRAATLVNRGILKIHQNRHVDALDDFESAESMGGFAPSALAVNRACALIGLGRYHEAIEQTDLAIRDHDIREADAWLNRGIALEALDELAAAYDSYRQARHLRPGWDRPVNELSRFRITSR